MIKFVLLDLDDTVLDFHKAESTALSATLSEMGIVPSEAIIRRYSEINRLHWERLERRELTRHEVLTKRFETLYREIGIPASAELTQAIYEIKLSLEHPMMDGAVEMLEELSKHYELYIVTNGTAKIQDRRISESGISKYFKDVFVSQRIGADKPRNEFFDYCFSHIDGFDKSSAIIIGDSLTSDILGGINSGIRTCHFNKRGIANSSDIKPDYKINDLRELAPLLKTI